MMNVVPVHGLGTLQLDVIMKDMLSCVLSLLCMRCDEFELHEVVFKPLPNFIFFSMFHDFYNV